MQWYVCVAPDVYDGSGPLEELGDAAAGEVLVRRVADRVSMASRQGKAMGGLEASPPERRGRERWNERGDVTAAHEVVVVVGLHGCV